MELSHRLLTVAGAVTPGSRVADIGTDHGYVPIYLVKNKICPKALAMDVKEGPLDKARKHIHSEGLEDRIKTRLGSGLEKLAPGEADTVIMAGMGGYLICRLLSEAKKLRKMGAELVLQPQSEWARVRHFLHDADYSIEKEWFLKEEGKYYVVIRAVPAKTGRRAEKDTAYDSELSYRYGGYLIRERHPLLKEYLIKEMEKKKEIAVRLERDQPKSGDRADNLKKRKDRCEELKKDAEDIRRLLEIYQTGDWTPA